MWPAVVGNQVINCCFSVTQSSRKRPWAEFTVYTWRICTHTLLFCDPLFACTTCRCVITLWADKHGTVMQTSCLSFSCSPFLFHTSTHTLTSRLACSLLSTLRAGARTQGKHLSRKSPGHVGRIIQQKTGRVCSHQGHGTWRLGPPFPVQDPILIGVIQFWWMHCHLSAKMKPRGFGKVTYCGAQM